MFFCISSPHDYFTFARLKLMFVVGLISVQVAFRRHLEFCDAYTYTRKVGTCS